MDFQGAAAAILRSEFQFAKTMPDSPHWYTLRKKWNQPLDWEAVVQFIRDNSYREKYGKAWYKKMNINGHKYWTMGAPLPITILINKAVIEDAVLYDQIAPVYDDIWSTPAAFAEDAAVMSQINYSGGDVLDIGCGTGLFLDHVRPDSYLGIDPSRAMLERLQLKHPGAETINTTLESYCNLDRKFDLIVSLFGSPSYVDMVALNRIPGMLKPGGRFFVMLYKQGYVPVTDQVTGVSVPHLNHSVDVLRGNVRQFGNFQIIEGTAPRWAASAPMASTESAMETSTTA